MKKEYIKPEIKEYECHPRESYLNITSLPVVDPDPDPEDPDDPYIDDNW